MANPLAATGFDPYGGFEHRKMRPASTPTNIGKRAPDFEGTKQNAPADKRIAVPGDFDSSRPGRRTDTLIQYSRVATAPANVYGPLYDELQPFSCVFVSSADVDCCGTGYDRISRIAGINAINADLEKRSFPVEALALLDLSGADPGGTTRAAGTTWAAQRKRIERQQEVLRADEALGLSWPLMSEQQQSEFASLEGELRAYRKQRREGTGGAPLAERISDVQARIDAFVRAARVFASSGQLLAALDIVDRWRFDGVVQTSDLREERAGNAGSNHMLYNIGVRGPSLLRNGSTNGVLYGYGESMYPWSQAVPAEASHVFDSAALPRYDFLITLHVELVPREREDESEGDCERRARFVYRYASTRIMQKVATAVAQLWQQGDPLQESMVGQEQSKLTADEMVVLGAMRSACGAWRVGSVIDGKASVAPNEYGAPTERSTQVKLSVDGRWVGLWEMAERYGHTHAIGAGSGTGAGTEYASDVRVDQIGLLWRWSYASQQLRRTRSACADMDARLQRELNSVSRRLGIVGSSPSWNDVLDAMREAGVPEENPAYLSAKDAISAVSKRAAEMASDKSYRTRLAATTEALQALKGCGDVSPRDVLTRALPKVINHLASAQYSENVLKCVDVKALVENINEALLARPRSELETDRSTDAALMPPPAPRPARESVTAVPLPSMTTEEGRQELDSASQKLRDSSVPIPAPTEDTEGTSSVKSSFLATSGSELSEDETDGTSESRNKPPPKASREGRSSRLDAAADRTSSNRSRPTSADLADIDRSLGLQTKKKKKKPKDTKQD